MGNKHKCNYKFTKNSFEYDLIINGVPASIDEYGFCISLNEAEFIDTNKIPLDDLAFSFPGQELHRPFSIKMFKFTTIGVYVLIKFNKDFANFLYTKSHMSKFNKIFRSREVQKKFLLTEDTPAVQILGGVMYPSRAKYLGKIIRSTLKKMDAVIKGRGYLRAIM